MSFTLVTHANEDIVLGAIRLASALLNGCPREAQDTAAAVVKEMGADRFFSCVQRCLRRFTENAKQRIKEVFEVLMSACPLMSRLRDPSLF